MIELFHRQLAGRSVRMLLSLALCCAVVVFTSLPAKASYGLKSAAKAPLGASRRALLIGEARLGQGVHVAPAVVKLMTASPLAVLTMPVPMVATPHLAVGPEITALVFFRQRGESLLTSRGPPSA